VDDERGYVQRFEWVPVDGGIGDEGAEEHALTAVADREDACDHLIGNRAADLLSDSAGLVHDNERRWRTFRARVDTVASAVDPTATP
jgi:hypothetical protein